MFHCVKVNPSWTKFFKTQFEKDIISKKTTGKEFELGFFTKNPERVEKMDEKLDKKALSPQKNFFLTLYDKNTRALGGKRENY